MPDAMSVGKRARIRNSGRASAAPSRYHYRTYDRGATSLIRADATRGRAHHESGPLTSPSVVLCLDKPLCSPVLRPAPLWPGTRQAPWWPGTRQAPRARAPDATSPAQVGRVHPNHPAALRLRMRMGSYSPGQLHIQHPVTSRRVASSISSTGGTTGWLWNFRPGMRGTTQTSQHCRAKHP